MTLALAFLLAAAPASLPVPAIPGEAPRRSEARVTATAHATIIEARVIDFRDARPPQGAKRSRAHLLEFE